MRLKTRQKFATEPKTVSVCTAQQQKLVNIQQFYFINPFDYRATKALNSNLPNKKATGMTIAQR